VVKTEKLQATPEQVRAMVEETPRATSSRKKSSAGTTPNRNALAKWKAWQLKIMWSNGCLSKAKVTDKAAVFDELMGQKQ
jgi:trigger factor